MVQLLRLQLLVQSFLCKGDEFQRNYVNVEGGGATVACPIVLFSYLNPILKHGVDKFMYGRWGAWACGSRRSI
ncbi:hypothetical protein ACFX1Q_047027 [Malus domestica]